MPATLDILLADIWRAVGGNIDVLDKVAVIGKGDLPSIYPVTDLAVAAIAVAGLSIAELSGNVASLIPEVVVDRRLASLWFGWSIRPLGWKLPPAWDPIAGDYKTKDGWIRLHTNAPHHRAATKKVLGYHPHKNSMAKAVTSWMATDLEAAVISAGGCAAEMRSFEQWQEHPQGRAVASEPLVEMVDTGNRSTSQWLPTKNRPLAGLKVLDLTRVLAGPVASRFLAGYGADVLRIDPPDWEEPGIIPEVALGKRCARLDLKNTNDRKQFEILLSQADILLHGYRPGALENLGYHVTTRRTIAPELIEVSLNAYGRNGPWAKRRGFDSLIQMSSGIAHAGMAWKNSIIPMPLPVQALDHATGYIMAAAAIRAITDRLTDGRTSSFHLSLARTAKLLMDSGKMTSLQEMAVETQEDLSTIIEHTSWGDAKRCLPPAMINSIEMHWRHPASALGSAAPVWEAPSILPM